MAQEENAPKNLFGCVHVAPFALHENQLTVIAVAGPDDTLTLPSTELGYDDLTTNGSEPLDVLAYRALDRVVPPQTLKPWFTQTQSSIDHGWLRIGYAAVTSARDLPADHSLTFLDAGRLARNGCFQMGQPDQLMVRQGLTTLGQPDVLDWGNFALPSSREHTLSILARMVPDPRSFTTSELHHAFAAIAAIAAPTRFSTTGNLDRNNFERGIEYMQVEPTTDTRTTTGRPARLWSMPAKILRK